jgi:hypothetical protein
MASLEANGVQLYSEEQREGLDGFMIAHPFSTELPGTVFHEHWWLAAATNGSFQEVTASSGGRIVGRLPFVMRKKMGFAECRMPPFTHILGPVVDAGAGKRQTQLLRRLSIIRTLIDQLPRFDLFRQALDLSILDGLAFQDRGFYVQPQYTFEIDCRADVEALWGAMHSKVRQHVRRAEEKFVVANIDDPQEFVHFYIENLKKRQRASNFNWETFAEIFHQSCARDSGEILSARWPDGRSAAMAFLVWGHGRMYYLLSTRADDENDNGSMNLLIWSAMKRANNRGLMFDLDGVSTSGTARFLSGFDGSPKLRLVVRRARPVYSVTQYAKHQLLGFPNRETTAFT